MTVSVILKRATTALCLLALVPAQDAPDRFATALRDYRAGSYTAAFAGFQAEFRAGGDMVPSALRWNLALAALRVQRSADAEAAIEPWLAEPSGERRADAEFVFAMACCQRAERAVLAAQLPDAEPTAWAMASQALERAAAAFLRASEFRGAWPEAMRNRERVQQRLQEVRQEQRRAEQKKQTEAAPPEPPPGPVPKALPTAEEGAAELAAEPLSREQVAALVRRLAKREQTKRTSRQALQAGVVAAGARGW